MIRKIDYEVSAEHAGKTVETFLKRVHGYSSRVLKQLKKDPVGLLLGGEHIRTIDRLSEGDRLTVNIDEPDGEYFQSEDFAEILYEDEDIIVFNKPYSMPTHPAKNHQENTLANVFAKHMNDKGTPGTFRALNRLDKDTTGAVLIAKNAFAAGKLDRSVQKRYTALCIGVFAYDAGMVDAPIGRLADDYVNRIVTPDGSFARTEFKVLARGEDYTLADFYLHTGRTHQIRVHMGWLGHPVAGDDLYGKPDCPIISRQALHCSKIEFDHPVTGEHIEVSAPLMPDMLRAVKIAISDGDIFSEEEK